MDGAGRRAVGIQVGAGLARCGIQVSARQAAGRCGGQVGAGRASSAGFSHMPTAGPKACGIKNRQQVCLPAAESLSGMLLHAVKLPGREEQHAVTTGYGFKLRQLFAVHRSSDKRKKELLHYAA